MESQNRIKKLWPHTLTLRNVLTYELTNCSHWLKEHPPVTLAIGIKSQVVLGSVFVDLVVDQEIAGDQVLAVLAAESRTRRHSQNCENAENPKPLVFGGVSLWLGSAAWI